MRHTLSYLIAYYFQNPGNSQELILHDECYASESCYGTTDNTIYIEHNS